MEAQDSSERSSSGALSSSDGDDEEDEPFEVVESAESLATAEMDRMLEAAGVRATAATPAVALAARKAAAVNDGDRETITEHELALIRLVELRGKFHDWAHTREVTIAKLRSIADYVDSVSR